MQAKIRQVDRVSSALYNYEPVLEETVKKKIKKKNAKTS